jgi:DNA-binding NarL/FixJ family response regulator
MDLPGERGSLRVLVVARQPMARAGLRGLLAEVPGVEVVGMARSPDEATDQARARGPDVVLGAWDRGDLDNAVALTELLASQGWPVVWLGDTPSPSDLQGLVRVGLRGFLLADAGSEDVYAALQAAAHGLLVVDPILARAVPGLATSPLLDESATDGTLTDREREVLQLLALGLPNKAIARRLGVSEHTIKFHVGSILAKLDAGSRTEAVTRAARRGLLAL